MGAAGFGGSFAPIVQYEKWEIHKVFPHFPYFRLGQNLAPNLLAPLCGIALIRQSFRQPFRLPDFCGQCPRTMAHWACISSGTPGQRPVTFLCAWINGSMRVYVAGNGLCAVPPSPPGFVRYVEWYPVPHSTGHSDLLGCGRCAGGTARRPFPTKRTTHVPFDPPITPLKNGPGGVSVTQS